MSVNKVAVIGSGVMGSGIAAHCANAGCEVLLLDIVLEGKEDRNYLSKSAITTIQKSNPEMLMHKSYINRISIGNIEDDISKISDVDWVIEVIIEDLEIKKILYSKLAEHMGPETIISSNTSTLPRSSLVADMPSSMSSKFLITHFFNPPRYLPLLEIITSSEVDNSVVERLSKFAEFNLGKNVIFCNDTPGFIGNRLGIFFTQRALKATLEYDLTVEQADSMLGRPLGIPKTAVFGLMDLVGIDLIPHVMDSMLKHLPDHDPFHKIAGTGREIIEEMISTGYTGRKGKGGFYRLKKDGNTKIKESRNLSNGEYSPVDKNSTFISAKLGKQGISHVLDFPDKGAEFELAKKSMAWPGWNHALEWLPLWNTIVLLSSSVTVHFAHLGLKNGNRRKFNILLGVTVFLALIFVGLQAAEYYEAYAHYGLTLNSGIYGSTFFMLTGFHGFHVMMGGFMLSIMLARSVFAGHFEDHDHFGFEAASWYWHFVDVVWVMLFLFVYIL